MEKTKFTFYTLGRKYSQQTSFRDKTSMSLHDSKFTTQIIKRMTSGDSTKFYN